MGDRAALVREIGAELVRRRARLAVAESLTAGHLQALLASVAGASEFFDGGVTTYSIQQKVELLGVSRPAAEASNAVGPAVAEQLACGVCRLFHVQFGVATTGYAEPAPERGIVVPSAWIAVAQFAPAAAPDAKTATLLETHWAQVRGDRVQVQQTVAWIAIRCLHRCLYHASPSQRWARPGRGLGGLSSSERARYDNAAFSPS